MSEQEDPASPGPTAIASTSVPTEVPPEVSVTRHNFFRGWQGGSVRWTEESPARPHRHDLGCGCTTSASERPVGLPESIRQNICFSWGDCVVALEAKDEEEQATLGYSGRSVEIWVTFRRAGDASAWIARMRTGDAEEDRDHSYFIFDGRCDGSTDQAKIEIGVPGFGLVGFVLLSLFLGGKVDVSRLRDGWLSSLLVDPSRIAPDRAWIYQGSFGREDMRLLGDETENRSIRGAFALADEISRGALPYLEAEAQVDAVREAASRDRDLVDSICRLRATLVPFAFEIEGTDLLRLAREMEAEAEVQRRSRGMRW